MTRKLKPVEVPLTAEVQQAVLSLPVLGCEGLTTVGELVQHASRCLQKANKAVQTNALTQLTANHLMRSANRRGTPNIVVHLEGSASLVVSYGEGPHDPEEPATPAKQLPTLEALRAVAAERNVDISYLGRQKLLIMEKLGLPHR